MVLKATFNNISVISWRSLLLVEETGWNPCPGMGQAKSVAELNRLTGSQQSSHGSWISNSNT
jgi:hypothetical protein